MNFLGRILVVTLCLMSVAFMILAMTVYSTHRHWKNEADAAQQQVAEEQARFAALQRKSNALESQLRAESDAAIQQVRKLESEAVRLAEVNDEKQRLIEDLQIQARRAIAANTATQESNNKLTEEVEELRDAIAMNQEAKDDAFAVALTTTEELQSVTGELSVAIERRRDLMQAAARMAQVMEAEGLDPNAPADGVVPRVDGFVSKTQRKAGVQLVEISIGSDDGLRVGNTVEVFNGTKYKGRLEILDTSPDRSVGRVDTRFQQGPIQEGDRVATRLNLGR